MSDFYHQLWSPFFGGKIRLFNMRGLKKAQAEFKLVCMALNLRRMGGMQMACRQTHPQGLQYAAD